MLCRRLLATVVALLPALALVFLVAQRALRTPRSKPAEQRSLRPVVETTRLNPAGDPSAEIDCATLDWVEFTYRVSNRGEIPITGLNVGTKCACEAVDSPLDKILPGEAGSIRFRLRAPRVGRIPLLADGASEPLALLDVALRVKFTPPALVSPTAELTVKFVEGDSSPHEVALEATEAKHAECWINGLDFDPPEGIEVQPLETEELPEADPELTRRRYRFTLSNRSLPVGRHMAAATVRTTDGSASVRDFITVWIEVVDPVAVVPNPLVIKYAPGTAPSPRRVCVVDRTGRCALATPEEYDRQLLRIESRSKPGDSTAPFDVAAVNPPDSPVETHVVFHIGDNDTRDLVVRFEPSERP